MSKVNWTPERHAQIDIAAGKPGEFHAEQFAAIIRAQFSANDAAALPPFRWMLAYHAELKRQGYEYGSVISPPSCDSEIVFRKIATDDEKAAAWASIENRMAKAGDAAWSYIEGRLPVGGAA